MHGQVRPPVGASGFAMRASRGRSPRRGSAAPSPQVALRSDQLSGGFRGTHCPLHGRRAAKRRWRDHVRRTHRSHPRQDRARGHARLRSLPRRAPRLLHDGQLRAFPRRGRTPDANILDDRHVRDAAITRLLELITATLERCGTLLSHAYDVKHHDAEPSVTRSRSAHLRQAVDTARRLTITTKAGLRHSMDGDRLSSLDGLEPGLTRVTHLPPEASLDTAVGALRVLRILSFRQSLGEGNTSRECLHDLARLAIATSRANEGWLPEHRLRRPGFETLQRSINCTMPPTHGETRPTETRLPPLARHWTSHRSSTRRSRGRCARLWWMPDSSPSWERSSLPAEPLTTLLPSVVRRAGDERVQRESARETDPLVRIGATSPTSLPGLSQAPRRDTRSGGVIGTCARQLG